MQLVESNLMAKRPDGGLVVGGGHKPKLGLKFCQDEFKESELQDYPIYRAWI